MRRSIPSTRRAARPPTVSDERRREAGAARHRARSGTARSRPARACDRRARRGSCPGSSASPSSSRRSRRTPPRRARASGAACAPARPRQGRPSSPSTAPGDWPTSIARCPAVPRRPGADAIGNPASAQRRQRAIVALEQRERAVGGTRFTPASDVAPCSAARRRATVVDTPARFRHDPRHHARALRRYARKRVEARGGPAGRRRRRPAPA